MSHDDAAGLLLKKLDGPALADPRPIRFVSGKRRRFRNSSMVAIGLAAGYMAPLESTSVHLIQTGITRLLSLLPNFDFGCADIDETSRQTTTEFEQIRDVIVLHQPAIRRRDSAFRNHCRTMEAPATHQQRIELFRAHGRTFRHHGESFGETGWLQVMLGQGITPRGHHPLADTMAPEQTARTLANVKAVIALTVGRMPTHEAFIAEHGKAVG